MDWSRYMWSSLSCVEVEIIQFFIKMLHILSPRNYIGLVGNARLFSLFLAFPLLPVFYFRLSLQWEEQIVYLVLHISTAGDIHSRSICILSSVLGKLWHTEITTKSHAGPWLFCYKQIWRRSFKWATEHSCRFFEKYLTLYKGLMTHVLWGKVFVV